MRLFPHLVAAQELHSIAARMQEGDYESALAESVSALNTMLNADTRKGPGFFGARRKVNPDAAMPIELKDDYDAALDKLQACCAARVGVPVSTPEPEPEPKQKQKPKPKPEDSDEMFGEDSGVDTPEPKAASLKMPMNAGITFDQIVTVVQMIMSFIIAWKNRG